MKRRLLEMYYMKEGPSESSKERKDLEMSSIKGTDLWKYILLSEEPW